MVSAVQRLQELKCEAAIIHALLLAYASKDGLEDRVQNPYNILQGLQCKVYGINYQRCMDVRD